jgi:hypothetical protein
MPMQLRSGKIINTYFNPENQPFKLILAPEKFHKKEGEFSIDFDKASKEWRKNKVSLGEGMFRYK